MEPFSARQGEIVLKEEVLNLERGLGFFTPPGIPIAIVSSMYACFSAIPLTSGTLGIF